ncbi:VanZ family protein [Tamlana crocina]|uniref:VanZ family protein n=1 Tax=Tamlana crocina TaxID=393006 RepID=A0ABX1DCI1_9FLAO|nr:VanZ family protein [Tamlana crocina]
MLKKLILLATILYTLALTLVCLIRLNNLPDVGVSFGDKIFHFLAYSVLTLLWFGTFLFYTSAGRSKAILYATVFAVIFGIIIEVLQDTMTDFRSLDIYDMIANSLGALLTAGTLWIKKTLQVKNQ